MMTLYVCRQLPLEYKLFTAVDKTWKEIMRRTEDRPNALKSSTHAGVLESLQTANANLEKIQRCLEVRPIRSVHFMKVHVHFKTCMVLFCLGLFGDEAPCFSALLFPQQRGTT